MLEGDVAQRARRIWPPDMDRLIGETEIGRQIPEQVEAHGRRPQQIGPPALQVHALMRLFDRRPSLRRAESADGKEVRAGLSGVREREATSDEPHRPAIGLRRDRLRTDRVALSLTPLRLVVAEPSTKIGHLRSPRHAVVRLPAMRSLELLLGENFPHVAIDLRCMELRGRR